MNGKEKTIDLVKGYNLPLQEKHTELFKKYLAMFKNGGISLHIYMRKPTRTYASGHTDVRMHKLTHIYVMTVGNKLLIQNLNNLIHIPTE